MEADDLNHSLDISEKYFLRRLPLGSPLAKTLGVYKIATKSLSKICRTKLPLVDKTHALVVYEDGL